MCFVVTVFVWGVQKVFKQSVGFCFLMVWVMVSCSDHATLSCVTFVGYTRKCGPNLQYFNCKIAFFVFFGGGLKLDKN